MKYLFCIDEVITGNNQFANYGVGITTDDVNASIHYIKLQTSQQYSTMGMTKPTLAVFNHWD